MIEFPALGLTAPDGAIIGVIPEGELGPGLVLDDTFPKMDAVAKARAVSRLLHERRGGATFVLVSHDEALLESCADEVWWLRDGKLAGRGDPVEVLTAYRKYCAQAIREAGRGAEAPVDPVLRDGDGRAELCGIAMLGADVVDLADVDFAGASGVRVIADAASRFVSAGGVFLAQRGKGGNPGDGEVYRRCGGSSSGDSDPDADRAACLRDEY